MSGLDINMDPNLTHRNAVPCASFGRHVKYHVKDAAHDGGFEVFILLIAIIF